MLAFATPLWLLGLVALAVPVVLHLRDRRPARVIQIGSVRWLEASPAARVAALRPTRLWLLLLRCAALAALALSLAGPYFPASSTSENGPWILVAPEVAAAAPLDSLRLRGTVRVLASGLPRLADAVHAELRSFASGPPTDVWSLLREADGTAPAGAPFVVVAPSALRFYKGARPRLARDVTWITIEAPPKPAAQPEGEGPVAIVAGPSRTEDARYLGAAFRAAALTHGTGTEVRLLAPADATGRVRGARWVAWLGSLPVPETILRQVHEGARLVTDGDTLSLAAGDRVVWRAGDGSPLLVARTAGQGTHFRLRGRFHPSALPMVLEPDFALLVDSIWAPAPLRETAPDLPLSRPQRTPSRSTTAADPIAGEREGEGEERRGRQGADILLALAALCWLVERALTARESAA